MSVSGVRFVAWDSNLLSPRGDDSQPTVVSSIVHQLEKEAKKLGLSAQITSAECKSHIEFREELLKPARTLMVMTHGSVRAPGFITDSGIEGRIAIEEVIPLQLNCDALVVFSCFQDHETWAKRVMSGMTATSPCFVNYGAIRKFAPALLRSASVSKESFELARERAAGACSTIKSRRWDVSSR